MFLFVINTAANLIFMSAYWVKDILWLRILSIVGSLVILPYYYFQVEPLWEPMAWSCVYMTIHGIRAWEIILERRPVEFLPEENKLYQSTFPNLSPQQFKKILALGKWEDLDGGRKVLSEGNPAETLTAILTGEIEARTGDRVLGTYDPGDFVGLGCIMTDAPEFCDATVTRPARVMRWNYPDLKKILDADQDLAFALRKTAGSALATKLIKVLQPA
jgi:CRP-like cAMP-binding protein